MFYRMAVIGIVASVLSLGLPAEARICVPLPVVRGEGNEVAKKISTPGLFGLGIRNNWNTDWAVPGGQSFREFVATIVPETNSAFNIKLYVKYSDGTADQFYDRTGVRLDAGEALTLRGTARPRQQPYQVNLYVGGLKAVGERFTASVVGCH